jgi:hypothetical protein
MNFAQVKHAVSLFLSFPGGLLDPFSAPAAAGSSSETASELGGAQVQMLRLDLSPSPDDETSMVQISARLSAGGIKVPPIVDLQICSRL